VTNAFLGTVVISREPREEVSLKYTVASRWRGRGIATEAVRLASEWAFSALGASIVSASVHAQNIASQRVAEKAGFARSGLEHSSRHTLREQPYDCVRFVLERGDTFTS
jgi:RimJ/RimL family protein N-acetyltransferase